MLRLRLAGLAFAALAPLTAQTQAAPLDTTIVHEVLADGIHLFRVPSDVEQWTATNTVVIVNETDVTVFDSNTRASTARRIIAAIRGLTTKPVRVLINSHWHQDHWSGNDEYAKAWPGVQIIATTETRDYMKRMMAPFFIHGARNSLNAARTAGRDTTQAVRFLADLESTRRVLPTIAYRDSLTIWSGTREFRLISVTGDATGSTVLYLPRERLLVMGDVLVAQEDGSGPPPWTTNSYSITPWCNSLRALSALDANIIVPGQGKAFRDKQYLTITADLFGAIIAQTHAALERGLTTTEAVQATVNVDAIAQRYFAAGTPLPASLRPWVNTLVRKVVQESFDGVVR
jgi:cyclase